MKGLSRGVSNYVCIVERSLLANLGMLVPVWSLRQEDCLSSGGGDQFGLHLSEEDHYNISSVIECVLSTVKPGVHSPGSGAGWRERSPVAM